MNEEMIFNRSQIYQLINKKLDDLTKMSRSIKNSKLIYFAICNFIFSYLIFLHNSPLPLYECYFEQNFFNVE